MKTALITGFGSFPGVTNNPTGALAEQLIHRLGEQRMVNRHWQLETEVVPVTWSGLTDFLARLEARDDLGAVIALGVARGTEAIAIESMARNLAATQRPDAAGATAGTERLGGGPAILHGVLHAPPFGEVTEAAVRSPAPVALSDDAGSYLCNAMFYGLLDRLRPRLGPRAPLGFLHVPHVRGLSVEPTEPGLELDVALDLLHGLILGWLSVASEPTGGA
ncbi:MAG: pyroglutamyl-peptidase I [Planctomycetota bacterium]|jgi:pyroglutamyl-peptidase